MVKPGRYVKVDDLPYPIEASELRTRAANCRVGCLPATPGLYINVRDVKVFSLKFEQDVLKYIVQVPPPLDGGPQQLGRYLLLKDIPLEFEEDRLKLTPIAPRPSVAGVYVDVSTAAATHRSLSDATKPWWFRNISLSWLLWDAAILKSSFCIGKDTPKLYRMARADVAWPGRPECVEDGIERLYSVATKSPLREFPAEGGWYVDFEKIDWGRLVGIQWWSREEVRSKEDLLDEMVIDAMVWVPDKRYFLISARQKGKGGLFDALHEDEFRSIISFMSRS